MAVMSVSLSGKELQAFDKLVDHYNYGSRSSAVRAALHHFIKGHQLEFQGHVHVALTVVYDADKNQEKVSRVAHGFEDLITTSLHNHLEGTCVDAHIVHGEGARVRQLVDELTKLDGVRVTPTPI